MRLDVPCPNIKLATNLCCDAVLKRVEGREAKERRNMLKRNDDGVNYHNVVTIDGVT